MFRSVYSRMLITFLLIIAFILLLQAVLLAQLYKNDYYNTAREATLKQAKQVASIVASPTYKTFSALQMMLEILETYAEDSTQQVWIVDRAGGIMNVGDEELPPFSEKEFNNYLRDVLKGEEVILEQIFETRFSTAMLSVGVPVIIDEQIKFAVFVHTELEDMKGITYSFYRHIFISSVIAVLVSMFLVLLSSKNITMPLKEINNMTKDIANGRFEKRIKIQSDDEIGQLASSFNDMADDLMKQEELRCGFVANVSHELRSPLTSIHGFAQGILDGTIDEKDTKKYIHIIFDETTRLKSLIKELLDLSQIESGQFPLHLQKYDINEHIRRVIIRYIDTMEENEIELNVDFRQEFCAVFADKDRIDQVLVNLLDNAIKFTPPGGTIKMWTHKTDNSVIVGVSDTGAGIADEDMPYIFERFYKADKAHTGKSGTGIGLSIVKKILDQHGQAISVSSTLYKGTRFTFKLEAADDV